MVKRRQFMAAAAVALAAVPALPRPRAAVAAGEPTSFPHTLVERTSGTGLIRPGMHFDHVAFQSDGVLPEGVQIRFVGVEEDGEWHRVRFAEHARDGEEGTPVALLAVPEGSEGYELRGGGEGLAAITMNTRDGQRMRTSRETGGTLEVPSALKGLSLPPVHYVTRAGWGADESLRFDGAGNELWPAEFSPAQTITVHHTALAVNGDPAAAVRAVYHLHAVEQAWGDIGYHLLIGPDGTIYEGRYSGEDQVPVFAGLPVGTGAEVVTAGHVGGYNSGNIGVCLLGDFTGEMPTQAAQDSLVRVLALLCLVTGVDPRARIEYVNPVNGQAITVHGVSRHRDWLTTECPGNMFAATFDAIRERVARLL
ncbi:peptidoglycan recognition protein family protein [Marinactinospora thermotolerans]|uniref:N-acetylmuramoyl-L-alanine amidase n=1 Tax=Marinactinospora thermotolerans DSM 45154 TaxID=1122192 RepID=A0A1T4RDL5_9ACTN|nr:peptidoglycan recognition family protein [Marinactinospora thermotolerans]SKA13987.1 N-acetylmuramoyl-L-alanine amidase [Marinactinospora thermotolerans DSM 45154]